MKTERQRCHYSPSNNPVLQKLVGPQLQIFFNYKLFDSSPVIPTKK